MSVSMYDFTIPTLTRGLGSLLSILEKASAHAAAKKIDPVVLAQSRLFPDMFPFSRQVQVVCDTAKGGAARLAGIEVPVHPDTETTLEELKARISKTLAFVKSVTPEQMKDAEGRPIELKFPNNVTLNFSGRSYLTDFVLPNFYFHISIAYALLRHNGVEVGKRDFLGQI